MRRFESGRERLAAAGIAAIALLAAAVAGGARAEALGGVPAQVGGRLIGVEPMEAIRAATDRPAVHMNAIDEVGTVTPGKLANLIAVRGDLLRDPGLLQDLDLVVKRGRRYQ